VYPAALTRGLWIGFALGLARAGVLFAMERVAHAGELETVMGRTATALPLAMGQMVLASVCLALFVEWTRGCALVNLRRFILVSLFVFGSAVFITLLAGWLGDDHSRRIGWGTGRGRLTIGALALLSSLSSALLFCCVPRRTNLDPILLPLVLIASVVTLARALLVSPLESMPIRQVVGNLLDEAESWQVVRAHASGAARVDVVTPYGKYALDGADMASIVLPPPGEIRMELDADASSAFLVGRVGIDQAILFRHDEALAGHSVQFEVLLDDEPVFEHEIAIDGVEGLRGTEWVDVGGDGGLEVDAGATLTLRTTLRAPDGTPAEFERPLDVGFGGMRLERRWTAERTRSSPQKPNIILVVMDTLRRDRLETYGYARPTSPHLERLAQRGVTFDAAYSTSSWTWPSTASILTGLHPEEHGVVGATSCYLADELVTLAESLQQEGFTTAAWSGNPLIVPDKNFDQGFEFYEYAKAVTRKSRVFMPAALEWLESMAGTRFFMYLHLTDPHAPLAPRPQGRALLAADVPADFSPKAIDGYVQPLRDGCGFTENGAIDTDRCVPPSAQDAISDLYDACVWTGDHWVGRLVATLERLELIDETLIVFTSDHGEELFDHGLVTHGHGLHEELVGVPLVFAGPGIPHGERVTQVVSNRHLGPTLARVGRGLAAFDEGFDSSDPDTGFDLRRAFDRSTAGDLGDGTIRFSTTNGWWNGKHPQTILGMRSGSLVVHFAPDGGPWNAPEGSGAGQLSLYDKAQDPMEFSDVSADQAERAAGLRDEMLRRVGVAAARRPKAGVRAGGSTVEMLRGLGYMGDEE
jgi:arylsulfatase A-like enzyme